MAGNPGTKTPPSGGVFVAPEVESNQLTSDLAAFGGGPSIFLTPFAGFRAIGRQDPVGNPFKSGVSGPNPQHPRSSHTSLSVLFTILIILKNANTLKSIAYGLASIMLLWRCSQTCPSQLSSSGALNHGPINSKETS
jgi:hypothetical protein